MKAVRSFNGNNGENPDLDFDTIAKKISNTKRKIRHPKIVEGTAIPDLVNLHVQTIESNLKRQPQLEDIRDCINLLVSMIEQLTSEGQDLRSIAGRIQLEDEELNMLRHLFSAQEKHAVNEKSNSKSRNRFEFAY